MVSLSMGWLAYSGPGFLCVRREKERDTKEKKEFVTRSYRSRWDYEIEISNDARRYTCCGQYSSLPLSLRTCLGVDMNCCMFFARKWPGFGIEERWRVKRTVDVSRVVRSSLVLIPPAFSVHLPS